MGGRRADLLAARSRASTNAGSDDANMIATAVRFMNLRIAGSLLATRPIVSPIAFPALQFAASKLQIESIPAIRQGAAFHIGQGEVEFIAGTAPDIIQRRPQGRRD